MLIRAEEDYDQNLHLKLNVGFKFKDKSDYLNKIKYEEDREKLKEEVKKAIGRSGIRSIVDDAEKARKAVSNAIRHALEKIERDNVTLAKHLRSSIKMGEYCLYNPEHEIDWKL